MVLRSSHYSNFSFNKIYLPLAMALILGGCASPEIEEEREFVRTETETRPHSAMTSASEDLRRSSKFASLTENVRFGFASAELTPTSRLALDEIAEEMKKTANSYNKVRIVGLTDPTGNSDRNARLSQARADKARDYLISRGVPSEKIESIGKGPVESVTKGTTAQQARARRVDFEIVE